MNEEQAQKLIEQNEKIISLLEDISTEIKKQNTTLSWGKLGDSLTDISNSNQHYCKKLKQLP